MTLILVVSANDAAILYQRANMEMNNLREWFCVNGLIKSPS